MSLVGAIVLTLVVQSLLQGSSVARNEEIAG